jgi:hypothetical protein
MCVRPSAGDLKMTNEIIGHHSVRNSAGTASGVGRIGVKSRMRLGPYCPVLSNFQIKQKLVAGCEMAATLGRRHPAAVQSRHRG